MFLNNYIFEIFLFQDKQAEINEFTHFSQLVSDYSSIFLLFNIR